MKNKKKLIVPLLLASVAVPGVATIVNVDKQQTVQADTTTDLKVMGGTLTIYNMSTVNKTVEKGDTVTLPTAKINGTVDAKVVVTKGVGARKQTIEVVDNKFVASEEGYYDIKFVDPATDTVVSSDTMRIFVKAGSAVISLPTNSPEVIPAIVPAGISVRIPLPTVKVDGKEVTGTDLTSHLTVKVNGGEALTLGTDNVYTFATTEDVDKTYEIEYAFDNGKATTKLTQRFQGRKNYVAKDEVKLKFDYKGTRPTTAALGEEVTLPQVDVTNSAKKGSNEVTSAYIEIKVKNEETGTEYTVKDYKFTPVEKGKYSVTYTAKIKLFGDEVSSDSHMWFIEKVEDKTAPMPMAVDDYKLDENGVVTNIGGNYTYTVDGENVTRTYNGGQTLSYGENDSKYTKDRTANKAVETVKYRIPSVVVKGTKVALPAIYATDTYEGVSGITLSRYITGKGYITVLKNEKDQVAEAYEKAYYTFDQAGDYVVYYKAEDTYSAKTLEYKIKVVDSLEDIEIADPIITQTIDTAVISKNATIKFDVPTARDNNDDRLDVRTYIIAGNETSYVDSTTGKINENLIELSKDLITDGKYSFKLEDIKADFASAVETAGGFSIVTIAINDFANEDSATYKPAQKVTNIEVKNTSDNNSATITNANDYITRLLTLNDKTGVTIDENGNKTGESVSPFDQDNKAVVKLPNLTFVDAQKYMEVAVSVYDPTTGKKVDFITDTEKGYALPRTTMTGTAGNYTYDVTGGAFRLSSAGYYVIEYKATDASGNVTVQTFALKTNDKTAPVVVVANSSAYTKEYQVGELFEVPKPTLQKNGKDITGGSTSWFIIDKSEGGDYIEISNVGYVFTKAGTYTVAYAGVDASGNVAIGGELSSYTVTVKDSSSPVIKFANVSSDITTLAWNPNSDNQMELKFSKASAIDNANEDAEMYRGEEVEVSISITDPDGKKVTNIDYTDADNDGNYTFTATRQGVYTITYSASDETGNNTTIKKYLYVGDCNAPELTWKNKDANLITTANTGDTFELITTGDNAFFTIFDENAEDMTTTISLIGPDNKEVTNINSGTGYKWKFDQTGDYTLKIVLKDKAGNSTQDKYKYTITVTDKTPSTKSISPVVGTVLIVCSVLILAGVIVYFVIASKKSNSKRIAKKK